MHVLTLWGGGGGGGGGGLQLMYKFYLWCTIHMRQWQDGKWILEKNYQV